MPEGLIRVGHPFGQGRGNRTIEEQEVSWEEFCREPETGGGHGRRAGTSAGPWVLILLSTVLFLSCSPGKKQEEAQAPIPVVVEKVRHINDFRTVPVSGSVVSPDAPSNVSFLIPGKVVNVGPREGEYVKKGQFLASIDPLEYRLAVEAAASETERARVASDRAGDEYERMKLLYESKSLAPNDFRKFKAAHDAALQQVEQAKAGEGVSRKRLSDTTLTHRYTALSRDGRSSQGRRHLPDGPYSRYPAWTLWRSWSVCRKRIYTSSRSARLQR